MTFYLYLERLKHEVAPDFWNENGNLTYLHITSWNHRMAWGLDVNMGQSRSKMGYKILFLAIFKELFHFYESLVEMKILW